METASPPSPKQRKPWPMTWIVVAIATYIVTYTLINVGYRKRDAAHEPWADAQQRRETVKQEALLDWTRFYTALVPARENLPPDSAATISRGPAPGNLEKELPIELVLVIPARPELARTPDEVLAPAAVSADEPWRIALRFEAAGESPQRLGEFLIYKKEQHMQLFLQDDERTAPDATPVPAQGTLEATLPPESLEPGEWTATLYCADAVLTWQFEVE